MTKTYYGYIRVSTKGQGDGASLGEQQSAIVAFAKRNDLKVTDWFTETTTAAKAGRREFTRMLTQLKASKANGVIIHKIDRSARNLGDWARIGELVDQGVDVRFAHDDLNINTRGGRLTADIQAVIAADFIRNNREEVKKGIYGWLKRGHYPFAAPVGYANAGQHRLKPIDLVTGPLVALAFELYATGRYTLDSLRTELASRGLTRKGNRPLLKNSLARVLRNPFYVGLIRLRTSGEVFAGAHDPLISQALFDRVQAMLDGRVFARPQRHTFRFKRLIRCEGCPRTLTGERQKGRVYYRCHTCPGVSFEEAQIDTPVQAILALIRFDKSEMADLRDITVALKAKDRDSEASRISNTKRDLAHVSDRLERLTDALVDGTLDKDAFNERKARLLTERKRLTEAGDLDPGAFWTKVIARFELWNTAQQSYAEANDDEKREILISLGSNFVAREKELYFSTHPAFSDALNWHLVRCGGPSRTEVRLSDIQRLLPRQPLSRHQLENLLTELGRRASDADGDARPAPDYARAA